MRLIHLAYEVLSSRPLLVLLGMLWMFSIWSSILYLSPGTDDAHFILEALGFIHRGDIGLLYIEEFHEFFLTLPPYAFLHGLFYVVWDGIGLPINYYTYKIFHLLALSSLIIVTATFVYRQSATNTDVKVSRVCLNSSFFP